jgi:hypothetical protein
VSFTRSACLLALSICLAVGGPAAAQDHPAQTQTDKSKVTPPNNAKNTDTIVLSGVATTARIADPNEPVVFNGYVMRMSDFVAAVWFRPDSCRKSEGVFS